MNNLRNKTWDKLISICVSREADMLTPLEAAELRICIEDLRTNNLRLREQLYEAKNATVRNEKRRVTRRGLQAA